MKLKVLAIVLLLVVGGAAVVVAAGGLPKSSAATVSYLTSPATVTDVSDDVAATGSVAASTAWSLFFGSPASSAASSSAPTSTDSGSWLVGAVKVKVGDVVAARQVLATAKNATLAADITAARNNVASASLQLQNARDAYNAATQTTQVRQTHAQLLSAQNALAQASTQWADLKATAARNELVAPAGGTVTAVNITAGADAPSGAAITIDATTYQVTADVVESDVSKIQVGQTAAVSVDAITADLTGTVSAIAPTAESSSSSGSVVSYAVTVDLASPPKELRSGMTANVTVTTASASSVLAVPAAAIRGTDGNYSVLVLVDGAAEVRPVTVGLMTSSLVEIKSGLSEGDNVVIGTSSQQRAGTVTSGFGGAGGGTFIVPGGAGGGRSNGRGAGN